ncbi:MAG: PKD domain-containing protein [Patescibacteria group bacterium]|nr:PKD domain-containing protein [Patescibacteria group bacterium]
MKKTHAIAAAFVLLIAASAPFSAHAAAMTTTNEAVVSNSYCTGSPVQSLTSLDTAYLPSDYNTVGKYCFQQVSKRTYDCNGNLVSSSVSYTEYSTSAIANGGSGNSNSCSSGGLNLNTPPPNPFAPATAFAAPLAITSGSETITSSITYTYMVPTVSLTGGTAINQGGSALLSWTSNMYNSSTAVTYGTCAGVGSGPSGSQSESPSSTTNYTETCTLSGGGTSAASSQTVTVLPPLSSSTLSCSVSPTSATLGQTVTWTGQTTGGTAPYNYTFMGDNLGPGSSGYMSSMTYSTTTAYQSGGTKSASLTVTDSSGTSPKYSYSVYDYNQCSGGTLVKSTRDVEDGGTFNSNLAIGFAKLLLNSVSNPQNYCATGEGTQYCNPNGTAFGTGTCNIYYNAYLYSSPSYTPVTLTYAQQSYYAYYIGAVLSTLSSGTPDATASVSCSNSVSVNSRPVAPTLTCPTSVNENVAATITANSSDPDGDNLRYGFDWTNSKSVGAWVPSSGYVTSGTSQSGSYSWSAPGSYTVNVLAEDSAGLNSEWSSCTIQVPTPVNGVCASTHYSCTSGTSANNVAGSSSWTWNCNGSYGGTNASCSEMMPVNGVCASTHYNCSAGTSANNVAGSSSWTWNCNGSYGGTNASCSESEASCAATTIANCSLPLTASGSSAGSCLSGYSGSCSYSCSNGTWSASSNTCSQNLPDLTAGNTSVSATPTTGTPTTFSASVSNIGNATATNFPNIFQIADSGITTTIAMVSANTISSLAPNASAGITASYTFSSPATYNVRACADTNTSWGHPTTESNTGNDCGAWKSFTVNYPALSASCSPSSSKAYIGDTVTWTAAPAGGSGSYTYSWSGTDGLNGTTKSISTGYSTTGTKSASVTVTGGGSTTVNCSPSVTVSPPPTALLSPQSATIIAGQGSVQLNWTSSNASSCTGTGFSTGGATSGTATVSPSTTTTYTLTCTDGTKNAYSTSDITVITMALTVTATPNPVRPGDTTTVSWNASGTPDSCTMSGPGISSSAAYGSQSVTITAPSTYTLTCVKSGASTSKSFTVNLIPSYQEI